MGPARWKYALGLELTDRGFDPSVLCEFRARLVGGQAEQLLFDTLLEHLKTKGFLKPGGKQRTDSTHVLATVRTLNHLELLGETLRAALNEVASTAPEWLGGFAPPSWFERYAHRVEDYRLPKAKAARETYARVTGEDGFLLLEGIELEESLKPLQSLEAVSVLRLIWSQHYERKDGVVRLLEGEALPKGAERLCSPYELEARSSGKRGTWWVGYKAHLTETCDEEDVHLITHVQTTLATVQDVSCTSETQEALRDKGLAPKQHLVDAGYVDAELLVDSQRRGVELIGPLRPNTSWQTKVEGAFDVSHFEIDFEGKKVTCPQGKVSAGWFPGSDRHERPAITVGFHKRDCEPCSVRSCCTRAKVGPRMLKLQPREVHEAVRVVQERGLGEPYNLRAGVEGTISQGTRSFGLRRCRYRGLARTRLQHAVTAAAMNVSRVMAWLGGQGSAKGQSSHFAALKA